MGCGRSEYAYFLKSDDAFTDHQRNDEYASPSFCAEKSTAVFSYWQSVFQRHSAKEPIFPSAPALQIEHPS